MVLMVDFNPLAVYFRPKADVELSTLSPEFGLALSSLTAYRGKMLKIAI